MLSIPTRLIRPSIEEYAAKYPELADEIRELLPALVAARAGHVASAAGDRPGRRRRAAADGRGRPGSSATTGSSARSAAAGMGVVYEAVQESLGPARGPEGPALARPGRLVAAASGSGARPASAARLHHTNIVPVFGVGEHDGVHYYAMQFIQGQGLDVVLDELRRLRGGRPGAAGGRRRRAAAGAADASPRAC